MKELGFYGGLVNGFSQIGDEDSAVFYDLPQYRPLWATVQELDVPFYLLKSLAAHFKIPLIDLVRKRLATAQKQQASGTF